MVATRTHVTPITLRVSSAELVSPCCRRKRPSRAIPPGNLSHEWRNAMATIFGHNPGGEIIDAIDGVTNGADVIVGNAGKDTIYGLGGDDLIKGGGGADYINGGSGVDTATYEDSNAGVQVSLQVGKGSGGTAEGDTLVSIENLYGSSHNDILMGDKGDNKLEGAGGDDTLKGGGGADKLFGGAGNDTLQADGTADFFDGGDGNDTVVLSESEHGWIVELATGKMDGIK